MLAIPVPSEFDGVRAVTLSEDRSDLSVVPWEDQLDDVPGRGVIVAVVSGQRRSGRHTLAFNVASLLAERGVSAVLVDCDPLSRSACSLVSLSEGRSAAADPSSSGDVGSSTDRAVELRRIAQADLSDGRGSSSLSPAGQLERLRSEFDVSMVVLPSGVSIANQSVLRSADVVFVCGEQRPSRCLRVCEVTEAIDPFLWSHAEVFGVLTPLPVPVNPTFTAQCVEMRRPERLADVVTVGSFGREIDETLGESVALEFPSYALSIDPLVSAVHRAWQSRGEPWTATL